MIPEFLCQTEVTIEPYEDETAYGASYGDAYTAKCYWEPQSKVIMDKEGNEVVSNILAIFRTEINIPEQSKVTYNSNEYTVVQSNPFYPRGKFHHIEVRLQ